MMKAIVGKGLTDKQNRTPEEDAMLNLLLTGGDLVSAANLDDVFSWYKNG